MKNKTTHKTKILCDKHPGRQRIGNATWCC